MKVHPEIVKVLSGPFVREDLEAVIKFASNKKHADGLKRLAQMTTTRKTSQQFLASLRRVAR